jgi:hypothetical protein
MKSVSFAAFIVMAQASNLALENTTPAWDISIPGPGLDDTPAEPVAKPAPIPFEVITSQTKRVYVTEAPEMSDLPLVEGVVDVTVKTVEDPDLPVLPRPVVASVATPTPEPEPTTQTLEDYSGSGLIFLSATVYDHSRTFLTISPNGTEEEHVSAWSNVDFNHLSGFCTFRVTQEDGTMVDYSLLMGIGNEEAGNSDSEQPQIPKLPDVAIAGPKFLVVEGETQREGIKILTQLHELYRKEGGNLELAFHAREKAHAERKAYLLANPQKPKDLIVHFWRGTRTENQEPSK